MMHIAGMSDSASRNSTPGDRLKQAREAAGFDHASEAARALRIPVPTYLAHESGERGIQRQAERYAAFFRVSLDWLLTGRGAAKGRPRVQELYDGLPPDKQAEALRFLEFLRTDGTAEPPNDTY